MIAETVEACAAIVKRRIVCTCHKSYIDRTLTDPDCAWHNYGGDAVDDIRALLADPEAPYTPDAEWMNAPLGTPAPEPKP